MVSINYGDNGKTFSEKMKEEAYDRTSNDKFTNLRTKNLSYSKINCNKLIITSNNGMGDLVYFYKTNPNRGSATFVSGSETIPKGVVWIYGYMCGGGQGGGRVYTSTDGIGGKSGILVYFELFNPLGEFEETTLKYEIGYGGRGKNSTHTTYTFGERGGSTTIDWGSNYVVTPYSGEEWSNQSSSAHLNRQDDMRETAAFYILSSLNNYEDYRLPKKIYTGTDFIETPSYEGQSLSSDDYKKGVYKDEKYKNPSSSDIVGQGGDAGTVNGAAGTGGFILFCYNKGSES